MRRAFILALATATLLLTGCTAESRIDSRYEACLEHGGDYEYDNWSGSYECDLPQPVKNFGTGG